MGGDFYIRKLMNHADSVKYLLYFVSFSFIEIRRICFKILFWKCILFVCCWLLPSLNTEIYIVWNMKFPEVQRTSARRIIYPWGSQQGIFSKEISSAPGEKIAKLSPLAGVFPHNISSVQPGGLGR